MSEIKPKPHWNVCCGKRILVVQTIQEENCTLRFCKCFKCGTRYKTEETMIRSDIEHQIADLIQENKRLKE